MTIDSIGFGTAGRPAQRQIAETDTRAVPGTTRSPTSVETANAINGAPSLEQVNRAVSELNKSPQARSQGLEFSIDTDSKRTVVRVIDQSTKEVLRQIPTPEALEIAKAMEAKSTKGVLIQQTA